MKQKVAIYDTTLRDGSQREGISFSVADKIHITRLLDELGVDYIEGGWPGSNPKDATYFEQVQEIELKHSKVTAFGSTRRKGIDPAADANIRALIEAKTPVVTVVGKTSMLHVTDVLQTTADENLRMIEDSLAYLKAQGKEVIYDAEHFFDGAKLDMEYGFDTLAAAAAGGADVIVLCDTNGGSMPWEVAEFVYKALELFPTAQFGIHTHNDSEVAVSNSLAAVRAGAAHVQGTINGYGERCGNANLCSIIPGSHHQDGYALPGARRESGGADAPFAGCSGDCQSGAGHPSALCGKERICAQRWHTCSGDKTQRGQLSAYRAASGRQ